MELRINSVRDRHTQACATIDDTLAGTDPSPLGELEQEIEEINVEIAIAAAQLELDSADNRTAFEPAVQLLIDAYRTYADLLEARATEPTEHTRSAPDTMIQSIRDRTVDVAEHLARFRTVTQSVTGSLMAGVLAALDDLDRATTTATSPSRDPQRDRGLWHLSNNSETTRPRPRP